MWRYKRVLAQPGKHKPGPNGDPDYRGSIEGVAPTSGELIALVGIVLAAEDRYPKFGRDLFFQYLRNAYWKSSTLRELCEWADDKEHNGAKLDDGPTAMGRPPFG